MRTVELDSMVLSAIQTCHEKWNLSFLQDWRPNVKPEPFEKGDIGHTAAKFYYTALWLNPREDKLDLIRETMKVTRNTLASLDIPMQEAERVANIVEKYFHYYIDKDGDMEIIAVEKPFSKILYEGLDRSGQEIKIVYTGIVDLFYNSRATKLTVMDHKTQGRSYQLINRQNQFSGYAWAFDSNYVVGNRIGLQKSVPDKDRFKRQLLNYPKALIEDWKANAIDSILDALLDFDRVKSGDKPNFSRRFNSCNIYGGCQYIDVCNIYDPEVKLYKLMQDFYKGQKWSPYTRDETKKDD